jgi:hypothetical protein
VLRASVEGIGLIGPGFDSWDEARRILAGDIPYTRRRTNLPVPPGLPPSERRRASRVVKAALAAGFEAVAASGADARDLATVFSSSASDGQNCHEICQQLATDDRQISPTRFHNSVHNAPAGYWSIASGAMTSASVLCAHDASFGAGLIEAMVQVVIGNVPVLLVVFDTDYPEPLFSKRPVPDAMGVGLVLAPTASPRSVGRVGLREIANRLDAAPDVLADPALEALHRALPAARALPLLAMLARPPATAPLMPRVATLDYLDGQPLTIEVEP